MIALDLAAQPQTGGTGQAPGGQDILFRLRDLRRFTGDKFHTAGGASRVAPARMHLIDRGFISQSQYQPFVQGNFKGAKSVDSELGHVNFSFKQVKMRVKIMIHRKVQRLGMTGKSKRKKPIRNEKRKLATDEHR